MCGYYLSDQNTLTLFWKTHFRNGKKFRNPEHPYILRINTLLLNTETSQSHPYGLKKILGLKKKNMKIKVAITRAVY